MALYAACLATCQTGANIRRYSNSLVKNTLSDEIRFLKCTPPNCSTSEIRALIDERYGIDGNYGAVRSERDQNFIVSSADGVRYVVKISNVEEELEAIDFQVSALCHIAQQNPSLPVPRVICDRSGQTHHRAELGGKQHIVHLLQYIDGKPVADTPAADSPAIRQQIGTLVAELDIALQGFFHPAANQDHPWNLAGCARFSPYTRHIVDAEMREIVAEVLDHATQVVLPTLKSVRHQVIHQDAHQRNVLVDDKDFTRVAGIIDFGDMVFGSLAAEVATACYSAAPEPDHALAAMTDIVSAYDNRLALQEAEIELIYDLICIRHAMGVTIESTRVAEPPAEGGDEEGIRWHSAELRHMQNIGRHQFTTALRRACRLPLSYTASHSEAQLLAIRRRRLGTHSKHFYAKPLHFEKAAGAYLYDTRGNAYLDFYNNVPQVGHCHPHVVRAISRQAATLNTNTRYLYDSVLEYAERLTATLAPHLDACIFVNSGSEANDVAWQMARFDTGGCGGLLMEDAYHGITDPIRLFSPGHPDVELPGYLQGLSVPDPYHDTAPDIAARYAADADRAIDALNDGGHPLAAFIVDSAFCSSGVPDIPDGYLRGVEKRVRAAGGLMICDEVQSGFGRMGQWWGHEHHGVKADIVTLGKPAGNGHPLGVVVTSSDLLNRFQERTGFFSTFGGNTVACAAGNAVLDVIERENLIENGRTVGDYLRAQLRELAATQALIGNVRGHGMLVGLEFVTDREKRTPATHETERLLELMRERQVLVGKEGRFGNVLKLRPNLALQRAEVDAFIGALDSSLRALEHDRAR